MLINETDPANSENQEQVKVCVVLGLGRINGVIFFVSQKVLLLLRHFYRLLSFALSNFTLSLCKNVKSLAGQMSLWFEETSASEYIERPRKSQAMTERRWLGNDNNDAYSGDDNSEQERGGDDPNNNDAG